MIETNIQCIKLYECKYIEIVIVMDICLKIKQFTSIYIGPRTNYIEN